MTKYIFCSETPDEMEVGIRANNGISYEYMLTVHKDMLTICDSLGRCIPIDITQIDQVIDALVTARGSMLLPGFPDTYVDD